MASPAGAVFRRELGCLLQGNSVAQQREAGRSGGAATERDLDRLEKEANKKFDS